MDWAEVRATRAQVVESMQEQLDNAKPIGINVLILLILASPVVVAIFLVSSVRLIFSTLVSCVMKIVQVILAPFFALYLWVDVALISMWYLKTLCFKLSGEKQK